MRHSLTTFIWLCALLTPTTALADDVLQAPNATFLIESEVLDGNQSNNLGPAAQWVLDNYWEPGDCPEGDSYAYCDILRFGVATFATSSCHTGAEIHVPPQEDGGAPVEDFITSNNTNFLCGDNEFRPLADALYDLQNEWFPGLDDNDADDQKDAWFDHPQLTLAVIGGIPPVSQGDGHEVERALHAACDVAAGVPGEVPPMPVWAMVARLHDDDAVPFAQLVSAAGQTGLCCDTDKHGDDCDPVQDNQRLDVCSHLDVVDDAELRAGLANDRYRCITAEDTWRTGGLDFETTGNNLPQITCHLTGLGPGNAGNPDVCNQAGRMATDLLGAFACIRQMPRDFVGQSAQLQLCDAAGCQTVTDDDYVFIDESDTLIALDGDHCDAVASGTGHLEVDACPMRGQPCDTGLLGRCKAGFYDCDDDGNVVCEPLRGPMPEICNGRDDSCDGRIDNVGDTIDLLPEEKQLYACNGHELCVCPEGPEQEDYGHDLQSFIDGQEGLCRCSSTLSPPDDAIPSSQSSTVDDDEGAQTDHDGGCSAPRGMPPSSGWLLALVASLLIACRRSGDQSPN